MSNPALPFIISIHPKYVAAILSGAKTVECRKSTIGLAPGAMLYLYATHPVCAIQGQARVAHVYEGSAEEMWASHQEKTCVTEADFFKYYQTTKKAVLLALADVATFPTPVSLATLREFQPRFPPPQTARRLTAAFESIPRLAGVA